MALFARMEEASSSSSSVWSCWIYVLMFWRYWMNNARRISAFEQKKFNDINHSVQKLVSALRTLIQAGWLPEETDREQLIKAQQLLSKAEAYLTKMRSNTHTGLWPNNGRGFICQYITNHGISWSSHDSSILQVTKLSINELL